MKAIWAWLFGSKERHAARTDKLIDVLLRTRALLALPENDYSWSSWENAEHALAEIDGLIDGVRRGAVSGRLELLFGPTGPIQEVSIESGWADEFLSISEEFDSAISASHRRA